MVENNPYFLDDDLQKFSDMGIDSTCSKSKLKMKLYRIGILVEADSVEDAMKKVYIKSLGRVQYILVEHGNEVRP